MIDTKAVADIEYLKTKVRYLESALLAVIEEQRVLKREVNDVFQAFITYRVNHP
jgi:hypothetical protein